jgi:hypothetical protein
LLLFVPRPEERIQSTRPAAPVPSDALIAVTFGEAMREVVFQALKRVEVREPEQRTEQKGSLKLKENTPVKAVLGKMSEMPVTVLSFSVGEGGDDAMSVVFLRTAFTVNEFQREMEKPIV